jgi:eukaryotic-like serine/threonine-protein kinase
LPDPIALSSDAELRALAERALSSNYELDREIGRGGMGIVYRAKDRRLKRVVAIKLLPPELAFRGEIRSRFLREAETAAQLSHPNIVPIYSVDEREGLVFFVMACIEGPTLARRMHDEGRMPVEDTRRILCEVADALAYAHARGVVHRDIKPDNILLDKDDGRAMVTDFGIARAIQEGADSRLTATGVAIGTPAYMSPEQAAGDREIDGRSDLYALGIVGYQMLAGRLPFQASSTPSMLMKHISERPQPVDSLRAETPPDLARAVMTLLEKEPEHRFRTAALLSQALRGDASAMPAPAPLHESGSLPVSFRSPLGTPVPYGLQRPPGAGQYTTPTADEVARWSAPEVQKFRGQVMPYAAVSTVCVVAAIVRGGDWMLVPIFWSVIMAFRYSKLWTAGFDWRDVFRQPRDRSLIDVAQESAEEVQSLFDKEKRAKLRDRMRQSNQQRVLAAGGVAGGLPGAPVSYFRFDGMIRQAAQDREDITRLLLSLPRADQNLVNGDGVVAAADGLFKRIQSLALASLESERAIAPGAAADLEREIARLESEANPLDVAASEERVRRLALLKRQRRSLADATRRRDETAAKLESCRLQLQNMRLDILRLRAGGVAEAAVQITQLTMRARALADDVDAAILGVDQARLDAKAGKSSRRGPRGT